MGAVSLDNHGITCRESRSSIAARNRKSERKVAGAEHRDWANWHEHTSHIGSRTQGGVARVVDDHFQVSPLDNGISKEVQLKNRAREFCP